MHQIIRLIFSLLIVLFYCTISYSQGVLLQSKEDIKLQGIEEFDPAALGFTIDEIPQAYSLRKYAPPVRSQTGGTCVGWATSYSALSIMYNKEFEITDPFVKYATAFDPNFIYSIIKEYEKDYTCDDGIYITLAAELMEKLGSKKWSVPPHIVCNTKWSDEQLENVVAYTKAFKTENLLNIMNDNPKYIKLIKEAVYNDYPVIFAVETTESFNPRSEKNPSGISSNGLWNPKDDEDLLGGHAMTIVGYNDYKFGGAFEIMNSWGREFGDNGYVWMKYEDFKKQAEIAFIFELDENFYSNDNPLIYDIGLLRVYMNNDNTFEGQFTNDYSNANTWGSNSKFDGFGQYIWDNNNVYSGFWLNGKQHGAGLWFKNSDYSMWIVEYDNGTFINSVEYGFSPEEENKVNQLKEYMKTFDPEMKFNSLSEEPDINIRSSQTNMLKNNK